MTAEAALVARATIAHHSKSFALASALLGRRLRDEASILYTWCRRVDDAIDLAPPNAGALATLHRELDDVYADRARDPVLAAFAAVVRERRIPRAYPDALLAGMAMDVRGTVYVALDDTIAYAYRVAGAVGLMMTHVFGVFDDAAVVHAAHLGIAMQLTNICRDVAEDARLGRCYVPPTHTVAELLAVADRYYASGDAGIPMLPLRPAIAVRAARDIYRAIGPRIAPDVERAVVPRATKVALALAAAARVLATAPVRAFRRRRARPPNRTLELADVPRV